VLGVVEWKTIGFCGNVVLDGVVWIESVWSVFGVDLRREEGLVSVE
jgi:hypothetical protein